MDVPKRIVFINGGIIMRTENRFMLGTIDEVSEEIAKYIEETALETLRFKGIDFFLPPCNKDELNFKDKSIIDIVSEGDCYFYGIKQLSTGFDNDYSLDLFADYYGGGCGVYERIFPDDNITNIKYTIEAMIRHVLEDNEGMFSFSKDTLIIAEWLEE